MTHEGATAIGASAGGFAALKLLLPTLPSGFPVAVVVVQHIAARASSNLPSLLADGGHLPVKFAEPAEPVAPGKVFLAPPGYHLLIEPDRTFALSVDGRVHHSRPSIDVLFESASDVYGADLVGVVLTGANSDGAAGLRHIVDCGGRAIVQDPTTASARMMPAAALQAVPTAHVLALSDIGPELVRMFDRRRSDVTDEEDR